MLYITFIDDEKETRTFVFPAAENNSETKPVRIGKQVSDEEYPNNHIADTDSESSKPCCQVWEKARVLSAIAVHLCYPGGFGQSNKIGKRRRRKRDKCQKGKEAVFICK